MKGDTAAWVKGLQGAISWADLRGGSVTGLYDVSRQTPGLVTGCVSFCNYHVGWELGAGLKGESLGVAVQQCLDTVYESLLQRFPNC